jgi:hypothetical protein
LLVDEKIYEYLENKKEFRPIDQLNLLIFLPAGKDAC